MCQEVAHTFGLDHQDEAFGNGNLGTCMDYTNNPAGPPSNEYPNYHDFQELSIIYDPKYGGHLDQTNTSSSTTSTGKMPPGMSQDLSEPSEWGRLIRQTHGGRTAVYERDFGGGHKVFTFVIWAQ